MVHNPPDRVSLVPGTLKWYFPTMGTNPQAEHAFVTLDPKGRATLPEEVRRELGVRSGDVILLERTDRGTFELVPAALVPRDQLWFHHPEMRRRVSQAEADFSEGRETRTRTPRAARSFLGRLKKRT
jgi:AbrB family looped-hinge helix DNA binding protein